MRLADLETIFYPEKRAGGFTRLCGTTQFFQRVQALLRPGDKVLDFGAGRGVGHIEGADYPKKLRNLQGEGRHVTGVDVDPIVKTNPSLDEAIVLDHDGPLPFANAAFDMIVSDFAFEHIDAPERVARELDRVLKPGGWLCVRATNRNGYVAIANRIIPKRYRKGLASTANPGHEEEDVFVAHYLMNTLGALETLFPAERYDHACYAYDSEPQYHFGRKFLFVLLMAVHHFTPRRLGNTLLCFLHKRTNSDQPT